MAQPRNAKPKYNLTDEQQAILDASKTGKDGIAEAFAGTGKTFMLRTIAQNEPRRKFHLAAYNRATADDAKKSFPRNATCRTMHSIAFQAVGLKYKHRLNSPRMRGKEVAQILGIRSGFLVRQGHFLRDWQLAMLVNQTLKNYCYSADDVPAAQHVPWIPGAEKTFDELSALLAQKAGKAWIDIQSLDGRLKFEHDHYLKMWALTHPKIHTDCLMVDEAQDSNPCVTGIVMEQDCQKILVGDQYQQLYAWRGAKDSMADFQADWRLMLSQSFRFGPAVANEGNKFLKLLGTTTDLKGLDSIASEVRELPNARTILCRTNATVIAEAMRVQEEGNTVAITGGTGEIESFAKAVQILQANTGLPEAAQQVVTHPDLMGFGTWQDVKDYVEEEGSDLKMLVDMVDRYGVPAIMQVAHQSVNEDEADTIVSTAHKSKGREWRSVRIAGDFKEPIDEETGERKVNRAEFMLCYVACTRAKQVLDNSNVNWVNDWLEPEKPIDEVIDTLRRGGGKGAHPLPEETNGRTIPKGLRKKKQGMAKR